MRNIKPTHRRLSAQTYGKKIRALLSPEEDRLFANLTSANEIQTLLDDMKINFRQTHYSPRFSLKRGSVQCIEGALIAAAAFSYHGRPPLLLDFRTALNDEDHIVAPFKEYGRWGAVSKTNHSILRFRDPVYASVRELAMSYFHEYALDSGEKTLREFSHVFDLRTYEPERWVVARENLWWLAEAIDESPHTPILPAAMKGRELRPISPLEQRMLSLTEWQKA